MKQFNKIIPLILLVFALVKVAFSADFYLFSSIAKVALLDNYEQPMSESDKTALGSGFPLEIVNSKITLGDQITDAIKCKNNGRFYYLIREESGSFTGSSKTSFQKLTAQTSLWDTVELTSNATLNTATPQSLSKGTTVIRVFQNAGSTYVFAPDRNVYGFIKGTSLFRKRPAAVSQPLKVTTNDIVESVKRRLDAANKHYTSIFSFFNAHTGQQKSVPSWYIESDGNNIICTLKGSKQTLTQMEQSTSHIVKEIERFMLGKPYTVRYDNYQITISTKDHP